MSGLLLAGMGLPGSGKSAVFTALAGLLSRGGIEAKSYCEPEESEWGQAVKRRDESGYFTAMTWFRAQRVPNVYQAAADRAAGKIALVDSFYDKLIHLYFDRPGFEWLMKADDPYRSAYRTIAALDFSTLPDADCVVTLTVSEDRWTQLVHGRGRQLDQSSRLLETHHTQRAFLDACGTYCQKQGIPHVEFENRHETALGAAEALRDELQAARVLR